MSIQDWLDNYTLAQVQAATKAQIVTAITNKLNTLTKAQILRLILELAEYTDTPVITQRPDGDYESLLEVRRNESGVKTGARRITWTYYETGEVDTITVEELDAADKALSTRAIKHFVDGRAPTLEAVAALKEPVAEDVREI